MTGSVPRRRRTARVWAPLFLLLFAALGLWSITIPPMASPDEPSHVVRAAALVRGQWAGPQDATTDDPSKPGAGTVVTLPADYGVLVTLPNCIAFHPESAADCQPEVPAAGSSTTQVETFAGQYPPLYYVLVGWPSLFLPALPSLYAMRLLSAAISAALFTWGVARLVKSVAGSVGAWAAAIALTPMCFFMSATVNPQGLEIAAAFAFWTAGLALAVSDRRPTAAPIVQLAVAGAVLASVRATGPIILAVAVVILVIAAGATRLRALARDRAVQAAGALILGAVAVAGIWLLSHGGVVTSRGLHPELANPARAVYAVAGQTFAYLAQMVGDFGWLDTPAPGLSLLAWSVGTGTMVVLASACAGHRARRAALALAVAATLGMPFALQIPTAADTGVIWQGRYGLPLAVGVPLMAAAVLTLTNGSAVQLVQRSARWVIVLVVAGHVSAFWWASHRYAEGSLGQLITLAPRWSSPFGYLTAVMAYTVVLGCLGLLAWRAAAPPPPTPATADDTTGGVQTPVVP